MKKRVVITGYGLVTPLGMNAESVWRQVCEGKSGIVKLEEPLNKFRTKVGGICSEFTAEPYLPPKEIKKLDRFTLFAVTAAIDAFRQSGLDISKENPFRCGSILGCGVGGLGEIARQQIRLLTLGTNKVSPYTIPRIMPNAAPGHISILHGFHGPCYSVATACASANNAMVEAYRTIALGEADILVTGGTESAVSELGISGFSAMRALSEYDGDPACASRPFDANRDGFVISEGAGILIFEELEHAKRRGAEILGEMLGFGCTTDASHITQPDSEGFYAAAAMEATMRSASLNPCDIDYINLHGTATRLGDVAETNAIKRALGEYARKIPLSSTKSQIGHLLGGSGGVEAIFSLLAIRDGIVPPTVNLTEPDPVCDLDFTPLVAREKKLNHVISNSFGFGGHNTCIAFARFED